MVAGIGGRTDSRQSTHDRGIVGAQRNLASRNEFVDTDSTPDNQSCSNGFRQFGVGPSSRLQAVQRLDALANATDVKLNEVEALIADHRGMRGLARFRADIAARRRRC